MALPRARFLTNSGFSLLSMAIVTVLFGLMYQMNEYVWLNVIKPISWTSDLAQKVAPAASLLSISEYSTIALKLGLLFAAFFVMIFVLAGIFAYSIYRNWHALAAYAAIFYVVAWLVAASSAGSDFQASIWRDILAISQASIQSGWLTKEANDSYSLLFSASFGCYLLSIPVIMAVCSLTLATRHENAVEHAQANYRVLVLMLYVSAVLLGLVTAVVSLTYRAPASLLDSEAGEIYRRTAAEWASYFGVVNSLIIALATLPPFALFRWQLERRLARDNPHATRQQIEAWLAEKGFTLNIPKVASAVIAIASPLLVSSQINLSGLG